MAPPVPTLPVHSLAATGHTRTPTRSTTLITSSTTYYPPPPPSLGTSLGDVHLHMQPAPVSFMPAYHYDRAQGLTLYHHNHYVHYTVKDLIIRFIIYTALFIVFLYLVCYLLELCLKNRDEEATYQKELENESIIVEEKLEVIHHADGGVTENRTVAINKYDYQDHGSDAYHANAASQGYAGH